MVQQGTMLFSPPLGAVGYANEDQWNEQEWDQLDQGQEWDDNAQWICGLGQINKSEDEKEEASFKEVKRINQENRLL